MAAEEGTCAETVHVFGELSDHLALCHTLQLLLKLRYVEIVVAVERGTVDVDIKYLSAENPQLSQVFPCQPEV